MHRALQNKNSGFGILEIVIASAILGGTLIAMVSVFLLSRSTIEFATQKLQASYLAEEGLEAIRLKRDSSWVNISSLSAGTNYYLSFSTSTSSWNISTVPPSAIEGMFSRSFQIENVSRDASSNIQSIYVPANDDPGTKKIIVWVNWNYKSSARTITAETYITNIFNN